MRKNIKVADLNIKIKDFFFEWLYLTKHFSKLTKGELNVAALLLYHHYRLQKEITNPSLLWKMVFDYDTKLLIREELGINDSSFQNRLTHLRNKNVIINNRINELFIPNLEQGHDNFKVLFNYNIIHDEEEG